MLGEASEAVKSATVVEKAESRVELWLAQLGQSLPYILVDVVALAVSCCLIFINLTAGNKDMG